MRTNRLPMSANVAASVLIFVAAMPARAQDSAFEFYGQLNFGILDYDDGVESNSYLVDNANSTSRIGFNYDIPVSNGKVRFKFETALGIVSSSDVNIVDGTGDAFDYDKTKLRKFEVIYSTDDFGTFSFGQGSMATDGSAGADFSGTTVVTSPAISDLAGGNFLHTGAGALTNIEVGDTNDDFDGSRRFRIRYDTPDFSGFSFAAAYGQEILKDGDDNDYFDIGFTYAQEFGDVETEAHVGYSWEGDDTELLVGSIAFLHAPTGVNGAFAAGSEDGGGSYYWIKAGIKQDWFTFGGTALSVDYYNGNDFESSGSDTQSWAFAIVQSFDDANVEAYAIYRRYEFDEVSSNYRDGDAIMVGGRWRF